MKRANGFTLLELLAGMAVFAVIAAIVLGGIRLGVRSWDAAAERSDAVESVRVVHALLRRQIASALPLASSRGGGWNLVFEGGSESLSFVSELPGYVSGGGIHLVSLSTEPADDDRRLILRWRPLHALDADEPPEEAVLAKQISRMRLEYFGERTRNALPEWRDEWRDLKALPRLVRISVEGARDEPWPDLVVRLEVDAVRFIAASSEGGETLPGLDSAVDTRGQEP